MIKRKIISQIEKWINSDQFIILKGARRVGKTTILKKIKDDLEKKGEKTFFINCDDLEISSKIESASDLIFYLENFLGLNQKEKNFIFLDEFQFLKNSGILLKNIYDNFPNLKIFASGSSSLEITKNTEFLTGRSIEFFINPISFDEICEYKFKKENKKFLFGEKNFLEDLKIFYKFYQKILEKNLEEYLKWGGYPQIFLEKNLENKKILFQNYLEKYIEKDIISFLKIENISAFNNLIKLSASQIGNLVNKNEISNTLGITNKTTDKYLDILEGTYLVKRISPFFKNIRSEISKSPKIYFYDLGLRNLILGKNENLDEINIGAEIENFIFQILNKNFRKFYFYRTVSGSEIDFIIDKNNDEKILIEVKYRGKVSIPIAFKNFSEKYPEIKTTKIVLTKDLLDFKDGVYFVPVCLFSFINI